MSTGRIIAIIIAIVLVLVVLIYLFLPDQNEKEIEWTESYHMDNKEPYGTYAVSNLLDNYFPKQSYAVLDKPLHKVLECEKGALPANYVCVSDYIYWSEEDEDSLLSFIENGNNAFISAKDIPAGFLKKISTYSYEDRTATSYFTSRADLTLQISDCGDSAAYPYYFYDGTGKDTSYVWNAIAVDLDSIVDNQILGSYKRVEIDSDYVNYVRIEYGEGSIYIHTMPLVFTNYFMITEPGREYAEKALSYLSEGNIYWDNASHAYSSTNNSNGQNDNEKSPLSFILSQKSLRWAWYICLLSVLLYIVFRAKRKQRIIPVIEPNINTSIMFIETIGKLYYMQNNHRKVAQLKMKHFIHFIRMKYKVNLQKDMAEKSDQLSLTAGVDKEITTTIFNKYSRISLLENISAQELLEFNASIQKFYKNCK